VRLGTDCVPAARNREDLPLAPHFFLREIANEPLEPALHIAASAEGCMSSVLVVDDEAAMRNLMMRWVERSGHHASTAASADEAMDVLAQQLPAVAVCDVRMPGHDGLWLADRIRREYPDTAVIMASGARDIDPRIAEHTGAVDYLSKPFGRDRLLFALERGFDWHHAATARREWMKRLSTEFRQRRDDLVEGVAVAAGGDSYPIEALLSFIAESDPIAHEHARRVAAISVKMGEILGLPMEQLAAVRQGALLHDLGKLALPDAILRKPAALSLGEKEIVRQHPGIGADLLRSIDGFDEAASVVSTAQERYDGHGYPHALAGDAIPLGGRIVAVADAFDSMTRTQIYRSAIPSSEAVEEILRCSNTQFDPVVVSSLLEVLGEAAAKCHE
jgi:response regulator RpfG family c-di-GMP phosphodiesterase